MLSPSASIASVAPAGATPGAGSGRPAGIPPVAAVAPAPPGAAAVESPAFFSPPPHATANAARIPTKATARTLPRRGVRLPITVFMSSSFSCVVPVCVSKSVAFVMPMDRLVCIASPARFAGATIWNVRRPIRSFNRVRAPPHPSRASAPSRSVERHRRRRRHHDRLGDLPNAGERHESIAWSASALRRLDRGRNRRAVRRADAGRGRRRVPRDGRNLRLHSQRVGTSSGVSLRLGGAGDHSRGGARRDRDDLRRVFPARARLRSERRAVRRMGSLRRGARHRRHRGVELRRRAVGLAAFRTSRRSRSTSACCSS